MDARAQELARKGANMFKAARERAQRTRHWAQEEGSKVLEKSGVAEVPGKAARQISGILAAATGSGGSGSSSSTSPRRAALAAERQKIETLCALGFSPLAARHALHRCRGNVEDAGLWLLDASNADEIVAAEMQAGQETPLKRGCLARITGLRGMHELNGTIVTLRNFDEASQRWTVFMPDGAAKAIRPFNLDFYADANIAQATQHAIAARESRRESAKGFSEEELRAQLVAAAGENGAEMLETLQALSGEDLLEAWIASSAAQHRAETQPPSEGDAEPPSAPQSVEKPSGPADAAVAEPDPKSKPVAAGAEEAPLDDGGEGGAAVAAADTAQAKKSASALECSEPRGEKSDEAQGSAQEAAEKEEEQRRRLAELEAREAELLEGQARLRAESESKADRIKALEEQCAALQRAEAARKSSGAEASQASTSPPAAGESEAILEQRRELQKLQEKNEEAARALQQQQEALEKAAQERELRLLEEESEQLRLGSVLREESARLDQQRRHVSLLQQSLLETSRATTTPTSPENVRVEVQLDDTACKEVHAADNAAPATSDPPSDCEDEVWDLDWNTLNNAAGGAKSGEEDASSSGEETESEDEEEEEGEDEGKQPRGQDKHEEAAAASSGKPGKDASGVEVDPQTEATEHKASHEDTS